ncbi:dihydrolipoyl dehydrogenase [Aquibacillus sediminis]|uniref:dihydrolipoyl dehydrogenase n=1 Tax=Aquibacillus sediminis TaxID=2574734 RepID=UPI001108B7FE|nr:dihydrolipoyl dehydrogenase [Aquibacillus sediminis]
MATEYDLVVLGGGTGGYVAAIRASQLGMKTAIVETEKLGGTCLHKGCIPSKALLRSAEVYRQSKQASQFGVELGQTKINFSQVQARKHQTVETLYRGVVGLMEKGKIDVYQGYGRILGPSIFSPTAGTVSVEYTDGSENEMLIPKYLLVATGSKARTITGLEPDGKTILTSDEALDMEHLPTSIIIVGGGVIGVEWASMLADFDVEVTVIEYANNILPQEDQEISKHMARRLKQKGVTIVTGANITSQPIHDQSTVSIVVEQNHQSTTFQAEKVLVSTGRRANTNQIGLDNTDVAVDENGFIKTNTFYQTKESHIYAIGDVIGGMQLAHVASSEGITAVEHMMEMDPFPISYQNVPLCIYSDPEVARVGLTEQQAEQQGYDIDTSKVSFKAIGKAHVHGDTDGFVKLIKDKATDDLLGVHMIGPHVTELISEASLAKLFDATPWEMTQSIHPHPSLSEIISETALAVEGRNIHG